MLLARLFYSQLEAIAKADHHSYFFSLLLKAGYAKACHHSLKFIFLLLGGQVEIRHRNFFNLFIHVRFMIFFSFIILQFILFCPLLLLYIFYFINNLELKFHDLFFWNLKFIIFIFGT